MEDLDHFFRLHKSLMFFVSQRPRSLTRRPASIEEYSTWSPANRIVGHRALVDQMGLIDEFIAENPFRFNEADLEIVKSWHHLISGKFIAYRQLKQHMIFLNKKAPPMAFGVVALFSSFEHLLGSNLPRMVETILLPCPAGWMITR